MQSNLFCRALLFGRARPRLRHHLAPRYVCTGLSKLTQFYLPLVSLGFHNGPCRGGSGEEMDGLLYIVFVFGVEFIFAFVFEMHERDGLTAHDMLRPRRISYP